MKDVNQIKREDEKDEARWNAALLSQAEAPTDDSRYNTLLNNSLVWIVELDTDGSLIGSNACGLAMLDITDLSQILGESFTNFIAEPHHETFRTVLQTTSQGGTANFEFPDADQYRWFAGSFLPVQNSDHEVNSILGVIQEISRRKMAERALHQKELILRQISEHIKEAFWLCDPDLGTVWYLSPGFEGIWGISRQDVFEDPALWTRCIHPDDLKRVEAARLTQVQGIYDETYRIIRPDGQLRWIRDRAYPVRNAAGEVYRLTGIAEDITSHKQSEEELSRSEERYRVFFNTMRDALVFVSPSGEIEDANPAFLDLSGYTLEELASIPYQCLTPEKWHEIEAEQAARQLAGRGYTDNYEKEIICKNGEIMPILIQSWLLEDDGEGAPMLVQMRDLTQHKAMESHNRKLTAQLLQAQKMETIGTLAGGIAHDFNNILTPILGFTRMAMEDDEEQRRMDLEQVLKAANRARELVKQILGFARQNEDAPEVAMIYPLVREAGRLLRASLPNTIEVNIRVDNSKDAVLANPTQIIQVLLNLGVNAYHAMGEEGGRLDIFSRRLEVTGQNRVAHPCLSGGPWVNFEVRDTGRGMDPKTLKHIFEAFFTTKSASEGTGLGLSVVHNIVEKHHGVITVASELGEGSVFQVYLPLAASKAETSLGEEQVPTGNERILLIDDEPTITLMCKKMLARLGYQVTTSNEPLNALALFRDDPQAFDLIITDQIMPRLTGLELAGRVRALNPEIPILIITGYSERVNLESCRAAGVCDFLNKPILTADLGKAIRKALAGP